MSYEREITLTVNGTEHTIEVEPRHLLVHVLREHLDLTGTHIGCDTGNCGACTVVRDGESIKSCMMFATQADGSELLTVEGLEDLPEANEDGLHPLQAGFREEHGLQCGFCTPGMMLSGKTLLDENPTPDESEIRDAISGNLCRCTGYQNIVKAVEYAANELGGERAEAQVAADGGEGAENARTDGGGPCGASCACGSNRSESPREADRAGRLTGADGGDNEQ